MTFKIPPKAFDSFGKRQVIDTLKRMLQQAEASWDNALKKEQSQHMWNHCLEILSQHKNSSIQQLSQELKNIIHDFNHIQQIDHALALLEREGGFSISDDQFMVSTEDSPAPKKTSPHKLHLVLDNLRSAFNVGSLLRTSEALGVSCVHLCGYTSTPKNSKAAKAALGAQDWISWAYWESTHQCLQSLREKKISLYALETSAQAVELKNFAPQFPCALILGNERYGLSQETLERVDNIVTISLSGRKNSLNVGVCGGMALYKILTSAQ